MDIVKTLSWIVGEGGAGIVAWWIMTQLPLDNLTAELKRYLAWVLSGACGMIAFAGLLWFGAEAYPTSAQEWTAVVFRVLFLAISGSQFMHARKELSKRQSDHHDLYDHDLYNQLAIWPRIIASASSYHTLVCLSRGALVC